MADVEARREARRRKILENSEKRLKKISGVEERNTKSELDGINLITPGQNESETTRLSNGPSEIHRYVENEIDLSLTNTISSNSVQLETLFQNPRSIPNDSVSNCNIVVTTRKSYGKVVILVMPILLSLILVLSDIFQLDYKLIFIDKIFVPLIIFKIIEYWFPPPLPENNSLNFLSSILLLTNLRNQFLSNFMQHFQYFLNIIQDVMIYFFVFSVSYWLLQVVLV